MIRITALSLLLLTSACAFSLGTVQPYPGVSKERMAYDIEYCRNAAFAYAGSSEKQAQAFLLGLTIVGAPVAHEIDKSDQRRVFRECMLGLGYVVDQSKVR